MGKTNWNPFPAGQKPVTPAELEKVVPNPLKSEGPHSGMTEDKVELYTDEGGKPRWRRRSSNGQITNVPGESFASPWSALRSAVKLNKDVWADKFMDVRKRPFKRVESKLLDGHPRRMS